MNKRHEGRWTTTAAGGVWGWMDLENVPWAMPSAPRFPLAGRTWGPWDAKCAPGSAESMEIVPYLPSLEKDERWPWKWRVHMISRSGAFRQKQDSLPRNSMLAGLVTNSQLSPLNLMGIKGIPTHLAICFLDLIPFPGGEGSPNDLLLMFMACQEEVWIMSKKQKDIQSDRKETTSGSLSHSVEGRCLLIGL